jgi:hypothetical protein
MELPEINLIATPCPVCLLGWAASTRHAMTTPIPPARKGKAAPASATAQTNAATSPPAAVQPPDSWKVQSNYGTLRTQRGDDLVRLEDVHAWLMQKKGLPSASAAAGVFSAFISDAGSELGMKHGAAAVRAHLYLADLSDYPFSIGEFSGRLEMEKAAQYMPYVPHHRLDKGTPEALFYALGVLAGEVWAPHNMDVDLNERLDGYCAEGDFPTVEQGRVIVGRFCVPFRLAHALWDWGALEGAADVAAPIVSSEWTGKRLMAEQAKLKMAGVQSFTKELANQSGLSEREVRRLIALHKTEKSSAMGSMVASIGVAALRKRGK